VARTQLARANIIIKEIKSSKGKCLMFRSQNIVFPPSITDAKPRFFQWATEEYAWGWVNRSRYYWRGTEEEEGFSKTSQPMQHGLDALQG